MRYMGIDYGSKRVGVAVSDEGGTMAFPKTVLPNNRNLMIELKEICKQQNVERIIVGASKNLTMEDNPIFKDVRFFTAEISRDTGILAEFEPEYFTSHTAAQTEHALGGDNPFLDASAAAIILQSYLDKNKKND